MLEMAINYVEVGSEKHRVPCVTRCAFTTKSKVHILEKYWIGQNLGFIKPNQIQGQSKLVIQSNLQNPTQSSTNPNGILKRKFLFGL